MTVKRSLLKVFYPVLMKAGEKLGLRATIIENEGNAKPVHSFYDLTTIANNGSPINFSNFHDKYVIIVNTASDCGYTNQLSELQELHERYSDKLIVIGFPSNDFKNQETGSNEEIYAFCSGTFGVLFLLARKGIVKTGDGQNEIFQWLTDPKKNGWNNKEPEWNFAKYLINRAGVLTHYFGPGVSPLDDRILKEIC